jgi:anti-sigma factor RsiW
MRVLGAEHASVDPKARGWRRVLASERECSFTPFLLAACLNGDVSDPERARFERHLESCLTCQAAEVRFVRAERAFAGVLRGRAALNSAIAVQAPAPQPTEARPSPPARDIPEPSPQASRPATTVATELAAALAAGAVLAVWLRRTLRQTPRDI